MKFRNMLFSSVAVAGLLLGAASISGARAAEVGSDAWNGFYFGVGGGGTASLSDVNATGYGETDFEFGDSASGSGDNFQYNFQSDDSGGDYRGDLDNIVVIGKGFTEGLSGDTGWDSSGGGVNLLEQVFNAGVAGFTGQAQLGADFENNGFLLGVNGTFGFGNLKQKASASNFGDVDVSGSGVSGDFDYTGTTTTSLKFGNSMSVGLRAGFLGTPSTLLFAGGGYTRQKVKLGANYSSDFDGDISGSGASGSFSGSFDISANNTDWANGFYVGGGVEQLIGENTALKLEYRYTDLGSISTSNEISVSGGDFDSGDGLESGVAAHADLRTHAVTATLNFRF